MRLGKALETRKGALFLTFGTNIVLSALGVVTGVLLARLLGPVGRGELAAITLWPAIILTAGGLGIPHTTAFFVASRPRETGKVYVNSLILAGLQSFALGIIGCFVIPIALGRGYAPVVSLSLIYLVSIPLSLIAGIHTGILQGLLGMKSHSLQRLLPTSVYFFGLGILFLLGEKSLTVLVGLLLLQLAVAASLGLWLLRGKIAPPRRLEKGLLSEILRYGLKTQAANGAYALNLRLDQLVMSIFLSPQSLGYYVVAATLSGAITPLSNAVGIITLPDVAAGEEERQVERVIEILRKNLIVLLFLGAILIGITPWLVPLLFGDTFSPSIFAAQMLIVGSVFLGMNDVLIEGLRGMNRPGIPMIAQLISLAMTVLLLYLLLPRFGITGAAVASVIAYGTTFGIMTGYLTMHSKLSIRSLLPTSMGLMELLAAVPLMMWLRNLSLGRSNNEENPVPFASRLQRTYDWLLVSSYPTNGISVPPRTLRYYVNLTGYEYAHTIRMFVEKNKRILVVGDAGGRDYYFLRMAGKEVSVLDIAPQPMPHFILGDVTKPLPYRDQTFDAVVMAEVIEHLIEDYEALKEVRRVLRDDGILVITVPFYHDAPAWHVRIHSPQTIRRLLEASGFRITEYIEKGGGCTLLERWRMFGYGIHALNLVTFLLTRRTFYRGLNSFLASIDLTLGRRRNSLWHRWSCLYGAFIKCEKSPPRDFRALNKEAFARLTPGSTL